MSQTESHVPRARGRNSADNHVVPNTGRRVRAAGLRQTNAVDRAVQGQAIPAAGLDDTPRPDPLQTAGAFSCPVATWLKRKPPILPGSAFGSPD